VQASRPTRRVGQKEATMFVQVIQGHVSDATELKQSLDQWVRDLGPGATGWLGSTSGMTPDGLAIMLARFESPEAARRNSDRPEQHQWWMETSKLFAGDVTFHDSEQVQEFGRGGSDQAGFVQIMQGRYTDVDKARSLFESMDQALSEHRPDVIGGLVCLYGDGDFTQAIYFSSEAEAREGEKKPIPPEIAENFQEEQALTQDLTFHDLKTPWLASPQQK
jgi:hypothetical protein